MSRLPRAAGSTRRPDAPACNHLSLSLRSIFFFTLSALNTYCPESIFFLLPYQILTLPTELLSITFSFVNPLP